MIGTFSTLFTGVAPFGRSQRLGGTATPGSMSWEEFCMLALFVWFVAGCWWYRGEPDDDWPI